MAMKIDAIMYERRKTTKRGRNGDSYSTMRPIRSQLNIVVEIEMKNLARNMNTSAIPSTKANLAEFFKIRMKELRAEEQKFSKKYSV